MVVLALAIPGATHAAEEVPGGSLCDAVSIEALATLGPLQYQEPEGGAPIYCVYEAAGDGTHSLTLAVSGVSFELMQGPDAPVYDVNGQPAIELEGSLLVDLGEDVFAVSPSFASSPDAAGLDVLEYAIAVAEIALPSLAVAPAAQPAADLQPPDVEGVEWVSSDVQTVAGFIEMDEGQQALWGPLVDGLGVAASDVSVLSARGRDIDSDTVLDQYSAIEVSGVEGEQLRSAVIDWLLIAGGDGADVEDVNIGGKSAMALLLDGDSQGYVYVEGNTAHAIPGPEDVAARMLQALP